MSQTKPTDDTIDLKELFFSLIAQWKLIILCVILSLIAAFLYLRITPDTYAVNAMVQVEEKKGASAALLGDLSDMIDQKSPAQAEIEILKSRLVLGQVVNDLNLDVVINNTENTLVNRILHQPQYSTKYSADSIIFEDNGQTLTIVKFNVPKQYLDQELSLQIQNKNFSIINPEDDSVLYKGVINQAEAYSEEENDNQWSVEIQSPNAIHGNYEIRKLSLAAAVENISRVYGAAEKGKLTGVIELSYQGQSKEQIVQVLNQILNVYTAQNIERRAAETTQTLKVLDEQLPELRAQLDQSERAFNDFRSENNTVDITKESELYLTQSIGLETKKIELEQKQAELAAKYTTEHPLMQEVTAQNKALEQKIGELNDTLQTLPDLQRQYLQLYRDVQVNTQLYTSLLNTYQQLKVSQAGEIGTVRIIDTAVEPVKPIKPKKLMIAALALIAGGFLGVLLALAKNLLRSGVRSSEEIENALGLPVYATVPRSPVQESRIRILKKRKTIPVLAVTHSNDIAIESLRSIRTALHFSFVEAKNTIISISGPAPELGKSFISTNLAAIFAQDNKKTLIIDADLRRGYLHKYFNQDLHSGLSQYLASEKELDEIIRPSSVENLDFIPRGKSPSNPSELLGSARFSALLEELSQRYERIIIDTPPTLAVTDSIVIAQHSGINLIVARYAKTQLGELDLVVNRYQQAGIKINGFILNDILREAGGGKYGYGYNYNYAYTSHKDD
ncbi:MAG: polysaccharide biosynthesis tyrosine autokinase [Acinetobacter sp.]|nr:polysaccharide biosynthesis tyrosine autokinase [Acinetobacter sp.]